MLLRLDDRSVNASSVIAGEAAGFDDLPPTVDSIHASLIAPSEYDAVVEELLCALFSAFSSQLLRLVEDHLPGGNLTMQIKPLSQTLHQFQRQIQ